MDVAAIARAVEPVLGVLGLELYDLDADRPGPRPHRPHRRRP